MKLLVIAFGSRGDIQMVLVLAKALVAHHWRAHMIASADHPVGALTSR